MGAIAMADNLATELETYRKMLPNLLAEEGRFALIHGDKLVGIYDTYSDALAQGYEEVGLKPFLVKKIAGSETAAYFSRDITSACT